jgi:hypothetical protein
MACALHEPIGSSSAMIWGHRLPACGERAKPLEGRVAVAHFGCCVFVCLCGCVVCVFSYRTFSHLTCKKVKTDRGFGLNFAQKKDLNVGVCRCLSVSVGVGVGVGVYRK